MWIINFERKNFLSLEKKATETKKNICSTPEKILKVGKNSQSLEKVSEHEKKFFKDRRKIFSA